MATQSQIEETYNFQLFAIPQASSSYCWLRHAQEIHGVRSLNFASRRLANCFFIFFFSRLIAAGTLMNPPQMKSISSGGSAPDVPPEASDSANLSEAWSGLTEGRPMLQVMPLRNPPVLGSSRHWRISIDHR
jgi:hypothetical protein